MPLANNYIYLINLNQPIIVLIAIRVGWRVRELTQQQITWPMRRQVVVFSIRQCLPMFAEKVYKTNVPKFFWLVNRCMKLNRKFRFRKIAHLLNGWLGGVRHGIEAVSCFPCHKRRTLTTWHRVVLGITERTELGKNVLTILCVQCHENVYIVRVRVRVNLSFNLSTMIFFNGYEPNKRVFVGRKLYRSMCRWMHNHGWIPFGSHSTTHIYRWRLTVHLKHIRNYTWYAEN